MGCFLKILHVIWVSGASPGVGRGGGQEYFFSIWKFACCFARGVRGHAPPNFFLKWCNLVRFGVYFDQILSLKNFKNYHFLYKTFNNCNFKYEKTKIF